MNIKTPAKQAEKEYTFEFSQEVYEKMQKAKNLHLLIPQEKKQDIEYMDISKYTLSKSEKSI